MAKQKLRVGIIGLSANGGWAALAHMPALRALEEYEVAGLAASSMESAQSAAEKFGVPFHTDNPSKLAARPDVDLVVVTVKVPHHRKLVEAAIDAGKMVFCEWPLGNGLEEAEKMAALTASRGVRGFVGLQGRSAPPVRYIHDLVANGYVGEVLSTTMIASTSSPWNGRATTATAYATDIASGASMLTIPVGHCIDALCWVLGDFRKMTATLALRRPEVTLTDTGTTIMATAPDHVAVTGELEGGAVAALHFRGGLSRGTNFLWEINGTKGDIVVTGEHAYLQCGMVKIQGGNAGKRELFDLTVPAQYAPAPGDPSSYAYTVAQAYRNLSDDIHQGTHHVPTFSDAVSVHRLLDSIGRAGASQWPT